MNRGLWLQPIHVWDEIHIWLNDIINEDYWLFGVKVLRQEKIIILSSTI